MAEFIKKTFSQMFGFFKSLTPGKRAALLGLTAIIPIVLIAIFMWAGKATYQPLMTNLSPEDSARIIRVLRDKTIPFKVEQGGKIVAIPQERIHDLRLELATIGLPEQSVVGYEVFDKQALGTTAFVQRINEKRAREGELMRTIRTIKGVKNARVHLAIPEKSAFVEDQKEPSASVILDVAAGFRLTEKQIYGIASLVSKSVEGLDVAKVVVVDSNGKTLSKNRRDAMVAVTADQMDYRRKLEEDFETRIENMLGRIVGAGKVEATVSAELDFSRVSETETTYDGDSAAVHSILKDNNRANGTRPSPGGVAGAIANQPGQPPQAEPLVKTDTQRDVSTTNYKVPSTVRRTQRPTGVLKRISVAVLVDQQQVIEKNADGEEIAKSVPWAPERITEFSDIVKNAVGFVEKRGDKIEVRNMQFAREDFSEANRIMQQNQMRSYIQNLVTYTVIGVVIVLFFLFVVRPFIKWVTENTVDSVDNFLPKTIEELEKMQTDGDALPGLEDAVPVLPERMDPEKVEGEMLREKIVSLVDSNPGKAALILRDWIRGEAGANKGGGDKSA